MDITKPYKSICTAIRLYVCFLPLGVWAAAPDFPTAIGTNPVTVAGYRVVGVTAATTTGAPLAAAESGGDLLGFAAMDRICQREFPDSRMATAREWQTSQEFAFPAGVDFVRLDPGPLSIVFDPTEAAGADWTAYMTEARPGFTASGLNPQVVAHDLSCRSYFNSSSSEHGTAGTAAKTVGVSLCNQTNAVACAAIVAVPVAR